MQINKCKVPVQFTIYLKKKKGKEREQERRWADQETEKDGEKKEKPFIADSVTQS